MTDRLEIIIIEIPKAKRIYKIDNTNELAQWMMFLDNPNKKEVSHIMEGNEDIKKAIEELETVSGNEELAELARLRLKAIRDEHTAISYAKKHGIEQGIEQGIELRNIEIAKNMLKKNISITDIAEITGLSQEEIIKFKNNIN